MPTDLDYSANIVTVEEFEALRHPAQDESGATPSEGRSTLPEDNTWPKPMRDEAFHGPAGDFVRLFEPQTEGDRHALLLTFLAGMGCMFGRHSYYLVGSTRHHSNLFVMIVGRSAKARKGTATDCAMEMLRAVDVDFIYARKVFGLSTGEGITKAIRDPSGEGDDADKGVADKRLFVVESEFAQPLQAMRREGNTLSATMRTAWDGGALGTLSRPNTERCKEPHVGIVGNITESEVRDKLTGNDRANGLGNRFLWCCAKRGRFLAYGGEPVDEAAKRTLAGRLQEALKAAQKEGRVTWGEDARQAWGELYAELGKEDPQTAPLHDTLTARAEQQCIRLAMNYALLDCSPVIHLCHLKAAVAVWEYCRDSVKHIFPAGAGHPLDPRILNAIRRDEAGVSRTGISSALSKNVPSADIDAALARLIRAGAVTEEKIPGEHGRPALWYRVVV